MNTILKCSLLSVLVILSGCSGKHLISDVKYRQLVDSAFMERKVLAQNRSGELFSVFNEPLEVRQAEALKFLYAFMPLSDLADYDGKFFLNNVNFALRAKDEAPWGKDIPEEIFLHFVLPHRVNNENTDYFRSTYYNEIMHRIAGKSLPDAALEINYWCHEKVSYQPADIRTSAPMSTVLSARGRCGEESTFTVAALRTAGIPARQVYTPRWAHSDDNHAWVEVWVDGSWHYMGACEPEPVLDRGWFTEPARRAMLIHTKSFGAATSPGNYVRICKNFAEVNNLAMYAVTKKICVKITDKNNKPVKGAMVEYRLYNYAEFYPLACVPSDDSGISRFETGMGDLLIWAYKGNDFDFRKISVAETDTLSLVLHREADDSYELDLDLAVPVIRQPLPGPPKELVEENNRRLLQGNEIRQAYISSWIKPSEAKAFAAERMLDSSVTGSIFERSMGNWKEIKSFLASVPDSLSGRAVSMLEILRDKDLRDTKSSVLEDHLWNAPKAGYADNELFVRYVLNPRVDNEMIAPWRGYFRKKLPSGLLSGAPADPEIIARYLSQNVRIDEDENYYRTPLTPIGVNELKVSDIHSRAICFVAICRTLGIPARLETGSKVPQYYANSKWNDLFFPDQPGPDGKKGYVRFTSRSTDPVPEYSVHFTLARFENGKYVTLDYQEGRKVTDFRDELVLAPGNYMLVTGNRLPDGEILTHLSFFNLDGGEHMSVPVNIRKNIQGTGISGNVDIDDLAAILQRDADGKREMAEKGMVIIWMDPFAEPSRHVLTELSHLRDDFNSWGGYFIFLTDPSLHWPGFSSSELRSLPSGIICSTDSVVIRKTLNSMGTREIRLPLIVVVDREGKIRYSVSGYRIGTGEQILRYIK